MSLRKFLRILWESSEKAGNIARIIRSEQKLFSLLIQEKEEIEKNYRFFKDFKTLADVIIQECFRHDISSHFPEIADHIYGEESNSFTNTNGETVIVRIEENPEKTEALLCKILSGNIGAAQLLTHEIHRKVGIQAEELLSPLPEEIINSPKFDSIGIWIDPIDGTSEYIRGSPQDYDDKQIFKSGLHCVTVLIGAFQLKDGKPFLGVVNHPFWKFDNESMSWRGKSFWGVSINGNNYSSLLTDPITPPPNSKDSANSSLPNTDIPGICENAAEPKEKKKTIVLSYNEDEGLKERLRSKFNVIYSSGAGYKIGLVILGLADCYLCQFASTCRWDTCSGQSILKSLGGEIIDYQEFIGTCNKNDPDFSEAIKKYSIRYIPSKDNKNYGGILAFKNDSHNTLRLILECLDRDEKESTDK